MAEETFTVQGVNAFSITEDNLFVEGNEHSSRVGWPTLCHLCSSCPELV